MREKMILGINYCKEGTLRLDTSNMARKIAQVCSDVDEPIKASNVRM
jgi:hypothetical protein